MRVAKSGIRSSASPLISEEFLEKETVDALSFASEYEARFLSSQNACIPTDLVQKCVQAYTLAESPLPEHEGMTFHLGCDWGRVEGGDRTVLTVVGLLAWRGIVTGEAVAFLVGAVVGYLFSFLRRFVWGIGGR